MKKYYTRHECADMLGVHPQTISNYIEQGLFKAYSLKRNNKVIYISKESFDAFIAKDFVPISTKENAIREYEAMLDGKITKEKEAIKAFHANINAIGALRAMINNGLVHCLFRAAFRNSVPELTDRELSIVNCLIQGSTVEEIADYFDLSRERIRQLIARIGRLFVRGIETGDSLREEVDKLLARNSSLSKANKELVKEANRLRHKVGEKVSQEKSEQNKWWSVKLVDCLLSVRTQNCMKYAGIVTVYDLLQCSRGDLLEIPNFGKRSLTEVNDFLESIGMSQLRVK